MIPQAALWQTLDLARSPANEIFPADINGDGRLEYLCLQAPGIYQSRLFNNGAPFWDSPYDGAGRTRRTDCCLTALNYDGAILWRYGQPKPYADVIECFSHVADQMVWVADVNGDNRPEVALIHGPRLVLLEGATGRILKQVTLDSDNYGIVRVFNAPDGRRLLVKNTERAVPPHWYGDPALIFDSDLNWRATLTGIVGSGHSPRAVDLNGDGVDELLIGYEAYDAGGRRLWRLDGVNPQTYDPVQHHVDQLQIGCIGDPKEPRIVYAGSHLAYLATAAGRLLWSRELHHPQHVLIGRFAGGSLSAELAFLGHTAHNLISFLRADGETCNVLKPPVLWPEYPDTPPRRALHSGEGLLLYPQGCPDGSDTVITRDWGWPRAYNLAGEEPFAFPPPRPGDCAAYGTSPRAPDEDEKFRRDHLTPGAVVSARESYGVRIGDADGDGRLEVLVHNLRRAWIFKPPYSADPGDPRVSRLLPVAGQGLYALGGG